MQIGQPVTGSVKRILNALKWRLYATDGVMDVPNLWIKNMFLIDSERVAYSKKSLFLRVRIYKESFIQKTKN